MSRTFALLAALITAAAGVAQPPLDLEPPPAEVVEVVRTIAPPTSRIFVGGEIGPAFGGWGLWRNGTLRPTQPFATRSVLFPIPVAEYDQNIDKNLSLAGRVVAGYGFAELPLTVYGSWETYHRTAETWLLGFDPAIAPLVGGLNRYNARVRDQSRDRYDPVEDALWFVPDEPVDHRKYPRFQMRDVPGEPMWLRSRVSGHVADATLAYRVWTPRESAGVTYQALAGGRYGGFFADDRAKGGRYEQTASNWFSGFGPHGGLRIDYRFGKREDTDPVDIRLWGEARGGALYGQITQRFREYDPDFGGDRPFRELVLTADRTVPFLATELGVGLFGARGGWVSVGVRYSHYWGVGNVGNSTLDFAAVAGFISFGVGF
jgi:hypothetical protein